MRPFRPFLSALLLAAPLLATALAAAPAAADTLPEPRASYRAMQTITVAGQEMRARVFHDQGRERRETQMDGMQAVLILNPADGTAYVVHPQMGMAMELPMDSAETGPDPQLIAGLSATAEGRETVAGEQTTRFRVADTGGEGGFQGLIWSTADGIYVRMDGAVSDGEETVPMRMELSQIERGPQEASLFALPPGVQLMQLAPLPGRTPDLLLPGGKR